MADALSSRRLVNTVAASSSTTMEKPKSSNRLSCGSGVAVSVGVVIIIAKVGVGAGILVNVGEGIIVAVGIGDGVAVGTVVAVGAGVCEAVVVERIVGVANITVDFVDEGVGGVDTSVSSEQAAVPVTIADRISAISSRDVIFCPALKDKRFIWACSGFPSY